MAFWYSPFEFPSTIRQKLSSLGFIRKTSIDQSLLSQDLFFLYDSPDRLIQSRNFNLAAGYAEILTNSVSNNIISAWRLEDKEPSLPAIDPFYGISAMALIFQDISILSAYTGLERRVTLGKSVGDFDYKKRLLDSFDLSSLIEN